MIYPFKRYEKIAASLLVAGAIVGTGMGMRQMEGPKPDLRVCIEIGIFFGWKVWCLEKKAAPEPQPCPVPSCDPQTQSCP